MCLPSKGPTELRNLKQWDLKRKERKKTKTQLKIIYEVQREKKIEIWQTSVMFSLGLYKSTTKRFVSMNK